MRPEHVSSCMQAAILQTSGGLLESVGQLAVIAGTLLLLLALVAFVAFAYKSLRGDGIEWPEDREPEDDELQQGNEDDEWKFY